MAEDGTFFNRHNVRQSIRPGGPLYLRLLHSDFAEFYCADNGRDSVPPSLLATALLLQAHNKVSDAEAKARADFDIRWKVALGIEVEDRPYAKSTLQVFRAQLILHDKVREVFESSLRLARESGYLKKRGMKVALDTTNTLGRGAVKDTFNLLADGIVKLLRALAASANTTEREWAKAPGDTTDIPDTWAPASRARRPSTGPTGGRGSTIGIIATGAGGIGRGQRRAAGDCGGGGTAGPVAAPGRGADR